MLLTEISKHPKRCRDFGTWDLIAFSKFCSVVSLLLSFIIACSSSCNSVCDCLFQYFTRFFFQFYFSKLDFNRLLHSDHRSAWILDLVMHFEKEWSLMKETLMWVNWTYFGGAWFGNTFSGESAFLLLLFQFGFFVVIQISDFENSLKAISISFHFHL